MDPAERVVLNFFRAMRSSEASSLNTLLENPLPILAIGAILATLCGLVFLSRRNVPSLLALVVVVLLTSLLLITEGLIVTPREEVETALSTLLDAVASNDVLSVLAMIDPAAKQVRGEAEQLMPLVDVQDTGATAIEIDVDQKASPWLATARCKGRLRGIHRKSGATVFYFDQVDFDWIRRDERWLLEGFTVYKDGKPLDAIGSLRGNRATPVPARRN